MDLTGTPEEIAARIAKWERGDLIRLICDLAVLEPHLSAEDIASRRCLSPRMVRSMITSGEFGPYYLGPEKGIRYRVPLSAVNAWDRRHRVEPKLKIRRSLTTEPLTSA